MTDEQRRGSTGTAGDHPAVPGAVRPTAAQLAYLRRGLDEPGGKLPLFDREGQRYPTRTIKSCIARGWAEPWFRNPIKPDWLICKLTESGRNAAQEVPKAARKKSVRPGASQTRLDARTLQAKVQDLV